MLSLDAMLSDLEYLVTVESPSNDIEAITRSAGAVSDVIKRRLGHTAVLVEGPAGPHVLARFGSSSRVLLVGHHDTVFPIGALAARPFGVDAGRATGPGVFDMKAGIVQAIHALTLLDDLDGVEMLITADEEVGSKSSRALIEERARACGAVLVLEPSADGGALKIGRKGTGTFEVIVHGRAAHAGLEPEKGINSLVAAAHLITRIATFGDPAKGTTVTPTVARAGTADNVVPALTTVRVDARVIDADEKERVEHLMSTLSSDVPGAGVEVSGGLERPPMPESASTSLFAVATTVAAAAGLGQLTGVSVGGGSDGNFTAAIGVPTLDGLGAVGGGAHADHEHVLVDTMIDRSRLVAAIVGDLTR
ncbi:MAG: glutamate carboxypeptidase [Ilumatobacteraceae bacterium]